jgi:mRNA interferase RelE/StbE
MKFLVRRYDTMVLKERFIVDENGKRIGVLLDIEDYHRLLEELEELEAIRAYDAAKASGDEVLPLGTSPGRNRKRLAMTYAIAILRRAQRELQRLPHEDYERVREATRALAQNPRPPGCLALTGRTGWRIRVGNYRYNAERQGLGREFREEV